MHFCIWKSPLVILLFLGYKAISVAGAECSSSCENGENCTSIIHNCTCAEGRTGVNCETAINCGNPSTPTNGQPTLSNTTYNSVVTYACDVNYTLQGSDSRTCQSDGQWSGSVPQCKISEVPSQVTGLSLSKAMMSRLPALQATWTTPQSDEPISQYNLQYRINGTTFWGSQQTISSPQNSTFVPRLAAGTEYDVRVRAVSAVGAGDWSAVQTERTYMKPPSPNHHTVSAVPVGRRGVIRVSWTAPTVPSGELPITGYIIRYKVQSSTDNFTYFTVMSNSETEVTGLNPGTVYRVYVAGVNAIGQGSYCCRGTPVHVRTYNVPSQVTGVAVSKTIRSRKPALRVTWTAPTSDVTISQYQVEYRRSEINWRAASPVYPGSATSTLLEALDAGTVYEVRIRAVSAIGNGMWSEVESETTYKKPPSPNHRTVSAVPVDRRGVIRVSWTAPTVPRGELPITGYIVRYKVQNSPENFRYFSVMSKFETEVTGLNPGTVYRVYVAGVSAIGPGSYCCEGTPVLVTTYNVPSHVASAVMSKTIRSGRPALRVTWTAPTSDVTISQYQVEYRRQRSRFWIKVDTVAFNSTTSTLLEALDVGTVYEVHIRAVSAIGNGSWNEVESETTYMRAPYPEPRNVRAVAVNSSGAIQVSWSAPNVPSGELPITGYSIQYKVQNSNIFKYKSVTANSVEAIITGLDLGTVYRVYVAGVNAIGTGPYCCGRSTVTVTTYNVPSQVTGVAVSQTIQSGKPALSVTWTTPQSDVPISQYQVEYRRSGTNWRAASPVSPGSTTSTLLEALDAGTVYEVRIRAVSPIGNGTWSEVETEATYNITSQPIVGLVNSTLQSLSVSWSVTSPQDVTNYMVFWWKESAEISKSVALDDTKFVIEGLLSNTAYHVVVLASGPLGNQNSTSEVFYTTPEDIPGPLSVLVLPKQMLKMSWKPSDDAGRSLIDYIVTTVAGMDYDYSTSVKHPITSVPISGLPQYSSGTVSVWAKNPGAMSKPVMLKFRMVNIVTNVSGVSAEWVDESFTSLRLSLPGGSTYRITYTSVNESNATETKTVTTNLISHVVKDFRPDWFYTALVEAVSVDFGEAVNGSSGIGIGIAVAVVVAVAIIFILLGLCCCWLASWHRRYRKRPSFLHFTRPLARRSDRSTINKPVVMVDVVEPNFNAMEKVDLQVESTPVDESGQADALVNEPNSVSKHMFPAHVREMHRNRDEGFETEFGNVRDNPNGADIFAKRNKDRNRYLNTNTFDHSRVILKVPDENGSDYINASYIEGYGRSGHYIASQGPKLEEVSIFWQMVMEQKPAVVVMLTKVEENGKRKCEKYWNDDLHKTYEAGRGFSAVTTGYRTFADYEVRDITVRNSTDRPHKLTHFQYTAWPDHGVPLHPSSLVKFVQEVRKVHGNSQTPMVVHCSAGVGRTGTFITLDAMMERLKERDDLNIFEFVNEMRARRKQMVQTVNQYAFIHDALNDYITCGDTSMMAHELRGAIGDMDRKDGPGKSGFENQFQFLGSVCKLPVGEDGSFAKKSMVAKKNRYKDKFPYSTNYLHIAGRPPNNAADYINATMMASYSNKRGYVAAQAPLESTRTDVWELIWQLKTKNIVLLGPMKEGKKIMCSPFWPTEAIHSAEYGQLVVTFVDTNPESDWEMTILQVADKNRSSGPSLKVTLFHFLSWPREGRPPTDSMLKMMGQVEKKQKDIKAPLMVMCDDGMSRSGVFITCMTEIERVRVEGGVDIFQTVKAARAQRPFMVYTSDQYKLCFEILQSHLDSFDTYANFKAV